MAFWKRYLILILLFGNLAQAIGQELNHANFRKSPRLNQRLDLNRPDIRSIQLAIAFATNEVRAKNRRSTLRLSDALARAAQMHADDMARGGFFSHNNPKDRSKKTPKQRAALAGILNPMIAENIAQNFGIQYEAGTSVRFGDPGVLIDKRGNPIPPHTPLSLADKLVTQWMNSRGHRQNILSKDALEIGCGVAFYTNPKFNQTKGVYACQNFQLYQPSQSR
ncbi:MAG: CAP domain-containing protein [Verrucomicrobiota bacterium]